MVKKKKSDFVMKNVCSIQIFRKILELQFIQQFFFYTDKKIMWKNIVPLKKSVSNM